MTEQQRKAADMALEALAGLQTWSNGWLKFTEEIQALRQALAQPEQEPVAWLDPNENRSDEAFRFGKQEHHTIPLYTAPPKREWVGLTDEEIYDYADKFLYQHGSNYGIKSFGKAIEAKLKEKNG